MLSDGPLFRHGYRTAGVALNGYKPISTTVPGFFPAFMFSLAVTEFPLLALAASQQKRARVMLRRGLPLTPLGWAGLGMAAVADLGYLGLFNESRKVGPMLGEILKAELGDDYTEDMAPPIEARHRSRARRLRAGETDPLGRYVRAKNVPYGPHGKDNHLDIWCRRDLADDAKAPVVIQIPGGAWVIGSKNMQGRPLLSHLVERGWVCVAINYRHAPAHPFPAQIEDVKRAIAWVKENIGDHGGDAGFTVVTGGSAGGHLASLAALTPNRPDFQPGFEDADTSVQACVPFYGIFDFLDQSTHAIPEFKEFLEQAVLQSSPDDDLAAWEAASPITHVNEDAPPFMILHGENDLLASPAGARVFAERLRAVSKNSVVHAEIPLAQHAFDIAPSFRTIQSVRAVRRFLESTWPGAAAQPVPADTIADDLVDMDLGA